MSVLIGLGTTWSTFNWLKKLIGSKLDSTVWKIKKPLLNETLKSHCKHMHSNLLAFLYCASLTIYLVKS